ncbi:MAG TPA: Ig-like domain-containing protein [Candidatus Angelobacter sp.]|nr:Ig-like domain-containing protein [Candidatus Angelobacter sp.]
MTSSNQTFAIPGAHVVYFGGPVVSNVHVVQVLYGTGSYVPNVSSTAAPSVATFSTLITGANPYMDVLSEYGTAGVTAADGTPGTSQTIGQGGFDGQFTITPSANNNGPTITDAQVQAELLSQVTAGNLPPPVVDAQGNVNTIYMIFFPPGKTIVLGNQSSCVKGGFCGYHSNTSGQFSGKNLLYSVLPDVQAPSACSTGCGGGGNPFDTVTNVMSHELAEAITDPDVGTATSLARPLAWMDSANGEIGDICVGQQATLFGNGNVYNVQTIFSNFQNDCVAGPPDFQILGGSNAQPGQSFDLPVTAQSASGQTIKTYTGTVHFTSSDLAAVLPADYTFTTADAGFHNFVVSLNTPGTQTITATDTAFPLLTGRGSYTTAAAGLATHFSIAEPGNATLGVPISVVVAARDRDNNIVANYTGTIHFTTTDTAATLPADSTLPNGSVTFSVTFNTAGSQNLFVMDTTNQTLFGVGGGSLAAAPPANPTTTTVISSLNTSTFGQTVTYAATVKQGTTPVTTGMVSISGDGLPISFANVDTNGQAQFTAKLNGGQHIIFADYTGGGSAAPPSSSAPLSTTVNPAPVSMSTSSSLSPSTLGSKIILRATLSAAGSTPDGGFVTFTDNGSPLDVDSVNLGGTGFSDTSLTVGSHTITASYSGTNNFMAASAAPFVQTVNPAPLPDYSVQPDRNSATIMAGQSATFVITMNSTNGFNGTIGFSCNNLPALATCTFTPANPFVGPTTGNTATTSLTIKTTGPHALLLSPYPQLPAGSGTYTGWKYSGILGFGILLISATSRKRRKALLFFPAIFLTVVLTSCGGHNSTAPTQPTPVTPAGTSTVVVSANAKPTPGSANPGNPSQQLNLSITIQP